MIIIFIIASGTDDFCHTTGKITAVLFGTTAMGLSKAGPPSRRIRQNRMMVNLELVKACNVFFALTRLD